MKYLSLSLARARALSLSLARSLVRSLVAQGYLLKRFGSEVERVDWEHVLSPGEQQCLLFACVRHAGILLLT